MTIAQKRLNLAARLNFAGPLFLLLVLASAFLAQAATKTVEVVRVKGAGANIYQAENDEAKVMANLAAGDEVTLVKKGPARTMVRTSGGIKGWVDNKSIEIVKVGSGSKFNLKEQEVLGWLDNPSAVYILDNSNPDLNALPIDRSFNDEIVEKRDREEVERSFDEN